MQFQITTDYAIRIMGYLYQNNNQLSTAADMSAQLGITYQYFMKVINRLKHAGLVSSVQGCNGGYQVSDLSGDVTLYDIISIMEGEIIINKCLEQEGFCSRKATATCPVHKFFYSVQEEIIDLFKQKRISEIWGEKQNN